MMTSVLFGLAGGVLVALSIWIRLGKTPRTRAIVARPRGNGPQDVLIMLPGIGFVLIGTALLALGSRHGGIALISLLLLAVGGVAVVRAVMFSGVPNWLAPSWYVPAPKHRHQGASNG